MTNVTLAQSYLIKARKRLKILPVLLEEKAYSDIIREAQEIVELAIKGMLRQIGIEPPKWHDVGDLLIEFAERIQSVNLDELEHLAGISRWRYPTRGLDHHRAENEDEKTADREVRKMRSLVIISQVLIFEDFSLTVESNPVTLFMRISADTANVLERDRVALFRRRAKEADLA